MSVVLEIGLVINPWRACSARVIASYPGDMGGKKQPGIHCMCMHVITQNLGNFAYSKKLS